jgi:hypothetical protein
MSLNIEEGTSHGTDQTGVMSASPLQIQSSSSGGTSSSSHGKGWWGRLLFHPKSAVVASADGSTNIGHLPYEVLELIFTQLDGEALLCARSVCRTWRNIASDPYVGGVVAERDFHTEYQQCTTPEEPIQFLQKVVATTKKQRQRQLIMDYNNHWRAKCRIFSSFVYCLTNSWWINILSFIFWELFLILMGLKLGGYIDVSWWWAFFFPIMLFVGVFAVSSVASLLQCRYREPDPEDRLLLDPYIDDLYIDNNNSQLPERIPWCCFLCTAHPYGSGFWALTKRSSWVVEFWYRLQRAEHLWGYPRSQILFLFVELGLLLVVFPTFLILKLEYFHDDNNDSLGKEDLFPWVAVFSPLFASLGIFALDQWISVLCCKSGYWCLSVDHQSYQRRRKSVGAGVFFLTTLVALAFVILCWLRVDGRIGWPWWTVFLFMESAVVLLPLSMMVSSSRRSKTVFLIFCGSSVPMMVGLLVISLQLDGVVTASWFLLFIPLFICPGLGFLFHILFT